MPQSTTSPQQRVNAPQGVARAPQSGPVSGPVSQPGVPTRRGGGVVTTGPRTAGSGGEAGIARTAGPVSSGPQSSGKASRGESSRSVTSPVPAEQSATGDLRSGFDAAGSEPILTGSGNAAAPTAEPGSQLGLGIGLLAFGLIALVGGFAVAATRRRHALVGREDSQPRS